jgi:hypothetical protein
MVSASGKEGAQCRKYIVGEISRDLSPPIYQKSSMHGERGDDGPGRTSCGDERGCVRTYPTVVHRVRSNIF